MRLNVAFMAVKAMLAIFYLDIPGGDYFIFE